MKGRRGGEKHFKNEEKGHGGHHPGLRKEGRHGDAADRAVLLAPGAFEYAKRTIALNNLAEDAQNGIGAFVEKKPEVRWGNR